MCLYISLKTPRVNHWNTVDEYATGFEIFTPTVADWPDSRPVTFGTLMYGHPPKAPVAFASVTPAGIELRTISNGPVIVLLLTFVIVKVPLKSLVTRLYAKPEEVTEI